MKYRKFRFHRSRSAGCLTCVARSSRLSSFGVCSALNRRPAKAQRKVAIIESGKFRIGLLFDKTGEIIYGDTAARINFEPNDDGVRDVVVEGMLKLDNGKRMVQVINPFELLKIEKLPRVAKGEDNTARNRLGKRLSCISFQLGHTICALDLRCVQEVMDVPPIQKSHLTHGPVLGTIDLRGYTLPVIDFRSIIGKEPAYHPSPEALKSRKLLILNLPEGRIGLLVFSIDSIVSYFESELLPFAKVALPRHDVVAGCIVNELDQIVILLDNKMLMADAELARAAKSCQEIYPPQMQVEEKETDILANQRRTFILFSIERCFALDTGCVCEVINLPEKLLTPPYALKFVEGILNLRGELITLIDPKRLYNMPNTTTEEQKVLIFHQAGQKYGILIDSVDEIVMTTDGHVIDVPSIGESEMTRAISEDVVGCLSVASRDIGSDPVLILNVSSVLSRCMKFDPQALSA